MKKHEAIYKLYPNIVSIQDEIAFDEQGNQVVFDEVAVQTEINKTAYIEKRQSEYPSFAAQFDTLFHGGYDAWKAQIQAVKDKYPKE